jgi:hypothetical protein
MGINGARDILISQEKGGAPYITGKMISDPI